MSRSKIVSDFNGYLDKATHPKQVEPNHDAINRLCEMIDEEKITAADAVQAIHGKIIDQNPHTVLFALKVLEVVFLKCGSIIHKVICTSEYMDLLRDMIVSTEHKTIKNKILQLLESWADLFKFFPLYCHPQRLLESLKSDDNGLTNLQDSNGNSSLEPSKKNYGLLSNIYSTTVMTDRGNGINSETTDTTLDEKQTQFKSDLQEYQAKKKIHYKQYLKSQGMPTSSDEEDNTTVKSEQACASSMNGFLERARTLPKDLEISRNQRHRLKAEIQTVRDLKHVSYLEDCRNNSIELSQCHNSNCEHCERFKNNDKVAETLIPKRWPLEIRKIKASKEKLKNDFEDYKKLKKESYYGHKSDTGIKPNPNSLEKKSLTKGESEEEEQLKQAILLSQMENETLIGHDDYLEDEEALQLAIDMSFAEADKNHTSPVPESDDEEDLELSLAKKLSLDETNKDNISTDRRTVTNIGPCVVCLKKNFLKRFEPCNDLCICEECADEYNSQICPVCRNYYSIISWNM